MFGIFMQVLKDKWKSLLVYIGSAVAFTEMYVALYPTLKDALGEAEQLLQAFPPEFMEAFGFSMEDLTFPTIESLVSTEMFTFIWPIILIILAISFANLIVAGDVARGTIEFSLAQPLSRIRLFLSRYLAGAVAILAFVWVSVYATIPLAALHNIEYNVEAYFYMSVLGSLFGLAIYGIAVMASAFFSEKGKTIFVASGTLITMYAVNIASNLSDKLENLKYVSFFYYFDAGAALNDLEFVKYAIPVFAIVALASALGGALWFNKRDIAT